MVVGTNGYLWPFKPIGTSGPSNNYIKSIFHPYGSICDELWVGC